MCTCRVVVQIVELLVSIYLWIGLVGSYTFIQKAIMSHPEHLMHAL
jgi:hypothetical protein